MIVSASYRTDIPAYYAGWFRARFQAGFARVRSPYGGGPFRVELRAGVDGFVFWTRNAAPFLDALAEVAGAGLPFAVHYTVTGYGRALEPAVPDAGRAIAAMRALADRYGPRAVVWRYDPILIAGEMTADWHGANFARLAAQLRGATDECVTSFVQPYRKTARRLAAHRIDWRDPAQDEKAVLLARLAAIARAEGIALTLCTQPELAARGFAPAACIDAKRLSDIAGRAIAAPVKGNRPGCLCAQSKDIGAYDSCAQGCVYCYAVASEAAAKKRLAAHDPAADRL